MGVLALDTRALPQCGIALRSRDLSLSRQILSSGGSGRLEPVEAAQANVTFRCATEPFVLLAYGRLTLPQAIAAGRIAAEGEMELIPVFAQWFRGV